MRTRIVQKKGNIGKEVWLWLGVVVILSGIGVGSYLTQPWSMDWFVVGSANNIAVAAKEAPEVTPVVIQKVSLTNLVSIVQVKGSSKVDTRAESLFSKLNEVELKGQKQFSYNTWFDGVKALLSGEPDADSYSYLASLLYEAAVKSGFQVGERHLHQQLPEYASPGFDVFVTPDSNGLSIYNPKEFPVAVQITFQDNYPILTLAAESEADWKAVNSRIKQTKYAPEQVEISDETLAAGSQVMKSPGKDGMLVEVTVSGQLVSKDFYLPTPAIIARGPVPDMNQTENEPKPG